MRPFTILSAIVAAFLLVCVSSGEESPCESGLVEISTDSVVNGFTVENLNVLPFSPVIEPTFNLPETCVVNILITDTLLHDTAWIVKERVLSPGFRKISYEVFGGYYKETGTKTVSLHIEAKSKTRDSGVNLLESKFSAVYTILLP